MEVLPAAHHQDPLTQLRPVQLLKMDQLSIRAKQQGQALSQEEQERL
jgi:hypothetical protein